MLSKLQNKLSDFSDLLKAFAANQNGSTAIEYAIIAAGIAGAIIGTIYSISNPVDGMYARVLTALTG
ncbi:MAG: Flp family type IVb pilin [Pseudomonadota bacterium]